MGCLDTTSSRDCRLEYDAVRIMLMGLIAKVAEPVDPSKSRLTTRTMTSQGLNGVEGELAHNGKRWTRACSSVRTQQHFW